MLYNIIQVQYLLSVAKSNQITIYIIFFYLTLMLGSLHSIELTWHHMLYLIIKSTYWII